MKTNKKQKAILTEQQEHIIKNAPKRYQNNLRKLYNGEIMRAGAVRLHCLICCGFITQMVANCHIKSCALNDFRPFQKKSKKQVDKLN
jgi:hypothetical protein